MEIAEGLRVGGLKVVAYRQIDLIVGADADVTAVVSGIGGYVGLEEHNFRVGVSRISPPSGESNLERRAKPLGVV